MWHIWDRGAAAQAWCGVTLGDSSKTKGIVTAEESTTPGALGGPIAEAVVQHHPTRVTILGDPESPNGLSRLPPRPVRNVTNRHSGRSPSSAPVSPRVPG